MKYLAFSLTAITFYVIGYGVGLFTSRWDARIKAKKVVIK